MGCFVELEVLLLGGEFCGGGWGFFAVLELEAEGYFEAFEEFAVVIDI